MDAPSLWAGLVWPLLRLVCYISIGLFVANLIESLNWTHAMAKLATPLIRLGRLKDVTGASFSMAFFSGVAANTMLSESFDKGDLSKKELILSNLFNSLPTYFLHMPTMLFITMPFIGTAAFLYVGLTFVAAILRTVCIVLLGRLILPPLPEGCVVCKLNEEREKGFIAALKKTWKRFLKRIRKILLFTVPIYIGIYYLNRYGGFEWMQEFISEHLGLLSFLPPAAVGIVVFHVAAEFTAGLAAAGALLQGGGLEVREVVLALLVGNVLSSPMRAFRHQFPYYAGIFRPKMALNLIIYNQALRVASVMLIGLAYFFLG